MPFAPATKAQAKARIALCGPGGSGKTYTALSIAVGLAGPTGRIAVVDTEHGSASKYADEFQFATSQMTHFDPRELVAELADAAHHGFDVVIVDSLSHFWMGVGGMLEKVDAGAARFGGNAFGGWKEARPDERRMIEALLAYPGHVIVTMRTKTEWAIVDGPRGKEPRRLGTRPEQREGIEYEFDVVGDLDLQNTMVVSKSRVRALNTGEAIRRPGAEVGELLVEWLSQGVALPTVRDYIARLDALADAAAARDLYREVCSRGLANAACLAPDGTPVALAQLIVARGKRLPEPAGAVPAAAQAGPRPGGVQRTHPDSPPADEWQSPPPAAPAPEPAWTPQPAAPQQPPMRSTADQHHAIRTLLRDRLDIAAPRHQLGEVARRLGRPIAALAELTFQEARTLQESLTAITAPATIDQPQPSADPPPGTPDDALYDRLLASIQGAPDVDYALSAFSSACDALAAGSLTQPQFEDLSAAMEQIERQHQAAMPEPAMAGAG